MSHERYSERYFDSMVQSQLHTRPGLVLRQRIRALLPRVIVDSLDQYNAYVWRRLWNYFDGCQRVLDVGCGQGWFLEAVPPGKEVVGIDLIAPELRSLRERSFEVTQANILALPFRDGSFDGAHLSHVIEHLSKNEIHRALKELRRVIRKDGVVVLLTPDFSRSYKDFYSDYTHVSPFTSRGLYRMLVDSGFKGVRVMHGRHETMLSKLLTFSKPLRFWVSSYAGRVLRSDLIAVCNV